MPKDIMYYQDLVERLDEGPWELSKWEVDFIASHLEHPLRFSAREREILDDMAEKYGL